MQINNTHHDPKWAYKSTDDKGRIYSNRTPELTPEDDKQYIDVTVNIKPPDLTLPEEATILWNLSDPDDPSNEAGGIGKYSQAILDPNDFKAGEYLAQRPNDNTGEVESHMPTNHYFEPISEDSKEYTFKPNSLTPEKVKIGNVDASVETKIIDGVSKIRIHVSDDGGDNFKLAVKLENGGDAVPTKCMKDKTGIMTVWKRLDVEYRLMEPKRPLNTEALEDVMQDAYVELRIPPKAEKLTPAQNFIDPKNVGYEQKAVDLVRKKFINQDEKQWHFLAGCKAASPRLDFKLRRGFTATGEPEDAKTYRSDKRIPAEPRMPGLWLQPLPSQLQPPPASPRQHLAFRIKSVVRQTGVFTVEPIESKFKFGSQGVRDPYFQVDGDPPNAQPGDSFRVVEAPLLGLGGVSQSSGPGKGRWALVFVKTVETWAKDDDNIDEDLVLKIDTAHEFVHSFNIHHLCNEPSINEKDPCIMQWATTPVDRSDFPSITWQNFKNGNAKLCAKHLIQIRQAEGK